MRVEHEVDQRGERELAKRFFALLGCTIVDTQTDSGSGSSILFVYPEPTCQDRLNNVVYLSEVRQPQYELEQILHARLARDAELRDAVALSKQASPSRLLGAHVVAAVCAVEHGTSARVLAALGIDRSELRTAALTQAAGDGSRR